MGNQCKAIRDGSVDISNPGERICYKSLDTKWRKIFQRWHNGAIPTTVNNVTAPLCWKEEIVDDTSHVRIQDYVSMCTRNRPPGVSNEDWEWYISSSCQEIFKLQVQDDFYKTPLVKSDSFSSLGTYSHSQTSVHAVLGLSWEESEQSSVETLSVSSVEFAGRFVLPNASAFDTALNAPSTTSSLPNWSSVCLDKPSNHVQIGAVSDLQLNVNCTTLCLKDIDISSTPLEEDPSNDEKKSSFKAISTNSGSVLS